MSKRIVVLSDGTGNAAASIWRTNVWRMFESLALNERERQVAFYDDGVGTSRLKPLAWFGGMFGYGLKRNVIECYKFICRNYKPGDYKPGDDIFLFGFSRGAFTVRVLADWILSQGLVAYENNEARLSRLVLASYRSYRREKYATKLRVEVPFRILRDFILRTGQRAMESITCFITQKLKLKVNQAKSALGTPYSEARQLYRPSIKFIGVWDTVGAYGLPVAELTRFISRWILPLDLPDIVLNKNVERACHALSVDDERKAFEPVLWTEKDEKPAELAADGSRYICGERISQVWFPGVHSNVGGGYPDDSLAFVPLVWMMKEAGRCGLTFKDSGKYEPDALRHARADKNGRLYNPRSGIGAYYRYGPRDISELCNAVNASVEIKTPKIHHTVFERIRDGVHPYAPVGLPATYAVVDENGKILQGDENPYEKTSQATERVKKQERVWDLVEQRRFIYLATVAVSLYLVLYPVIFVRPRSFLESRASELSSPLAPFSQFVRFVGSFLPDTFNLWVNGYAHAPWHVNWINRLDSFHLYEQQTLSTDRR